MWPSAGGGGIGGAFSTFEGLCDAAGGLAWSGELEVVGVSCEATELMTEVGTVETEEVVLAADRAPDTMLSRSY